MDQPYSAWADLLNKIHTSSDIIQALWILAVPTTIVGTALCLAWCVKEIAALRVRPGKLQGWADYTIDRMPEGSWGQDGSPTPPVIPGRRSRARNP